MTPEECIDSISSSLNPISLSISAVCSPNLGAKDLGAVGVPWKSTGVEIISVPVEPSGTSSNAPDPLKV